MCPLLTSYTYLSSYVVCNVFSSYQLVVITVLQLQLGIQPTSNIPSTPEEAWDELIARISGFFIDEVSIIASSPYTAAFLPVEKCSRVLLGLLGSLYLTVRYITTANLSSKFKNEVTPIVLMYCD